VSQITTQRFNLLEFLAIASNLTTNIDCPISSTVKNVTVTEAPVQHIDVNNSEVDTKTDSNQIILALFVKLVNCNINVYNNCNFTK
jgi:hypothetical protein